MNEKSSNFADDPKPWTVLSSRYLYREEPWLVIREDHVALPNGVEIERYWVNEYPTWVNTIAVTGDDQVVLVRQYRHGLGSIGYELPGGVAETDDPLECARRELLEETGYGGGDWQPFMTLSANPSLQNNLTHTFLTRGVSLISEPSHEPTEDLRVHLLRIDEITPMIDRGEVQQALHVGPLLRFVAQKAHRPPSLEDGRL